MKMLREFDENRNVKLALQKTYNNAFFPNGFSKFTDSLIIEQLATSISKRSVPNGIVWTDELRVGGICLETSQFPALYKQNAGTLTISGSKDSLEMFECLLERHNVEYDGKSTPEKITVKVEYHDELNPKLWDGDELKEDVTQALSDIADAFFEFLKMPKLEIIDVTFTGSCANYNWTNESDIDLHLVVDKEKAEKEFGSIVMEYFEAKKKVWNDLHDIKVKGIPVEVYVQDEDEEHNSTGVWSLLNHEWNIEPKHEKPSIDDAAVKAKTAEWVSMIKDAINNCDRADKIERIMDKLRTMRQAGLEEAGEFSTENIVFKALRTAGLLDKLAECKTKAFDREISVEEEEWDALRDKDDPWEDIGYTRKQPTPKVAPQKRSRINLNVPYAHIDRAKKAGARFDPGIRKWYMMVTPEELKKIPSVWR